MQITERAYDLSQPKSLIISESIHTLPLIFMRLDQRRVAPSDQALDNVPPSFLQNKGVVHLDPRMRDTA